MRISDLAADLAATAGADFRRCASVGQTGGPAARTGDLLVVGDGIREGVERIADYLKQSAGIRFTFGLVELAIFDMPDESVGGIIVEPRVLARTYEIERVVVRVADARVVVEEPPTTDPSSRDGGGRRKPITVGEYYEQIGRIDAALPQRLRGFFDRCQREGLGRDRLEVTLARASYILHWRQDDGRKVNFGTLFPNGDLYTNYIVGSAWERGNLQIGVDYLEAVARLVPGATVKKDGKPWTWCVVVGGRKPKIADVLKRSDEPRDVRLAGVVVAAGVRDTDDRAGEGVVGVAHRLDERFRARFALRSIVLPPLERVFGRCT